MDANANHAPRPSWHTMDADAVAARFETTRDGLDPDEARRRLRASGSTHFPRFEQRADSSPPAV